MPFYSGQPDYYPVTVDQNIATELKEIRSALNWREYPLYCSMRAGSFFSDFIDFSSKQATPSVPTGAPSLLVINTDDQDRLFDFLLKHKNSLFDREPSPSQSTPQPVKRKLAYLAGDTKGPSKSKDPTKVFRANETHFMCDVPVMYPGCSRNIYMLPR